MICKSPDGKKFFGVDTSAHDLHSNFVIGLNDGVVVFAPVHRGIRRQIEFHIGRNGLLRYETLERSDLHENSDLVDLGDHSLQDLSLEGSEHDRLVLHWKLGESPARKEMSGSDRVDGGHGYDEAVLARTGSLDFVEKFLLDRHQELRTKVLWVKEDFVME